MKGKLNGVTLYKLTTTGMTKLAMKKELKSKGINYYRYIGKMKSIVSTNGFILKDDSICNITVNTSQYSKESLLLDIKNNGKIKKKLLLYLIGNHFKISKNCDEHLFCSRKQAISIFCYITNFEYKEYRGMSLEDKARIVIVCLLKYVNSITLIEYFRNQKIKFLDDFSKCETEINSRVNTSEVICERDFLIIVLAIYVESIYKTINTKSTYEFYNLYFQKHDNTCDLNLSEESKKEFSRALVIYENIKNNKVKNLYIKYNIPTLDKLFGDGYFFTAYVVNRVGISFYDQRYRYIFSRFISSCILNDLNKIDDLKLEFNDMMKLQSHIQNIELNSKNNRSFNKSKTLSLKENREFLLKGKKIISELSCDATILVESGMPFCTFNIFRCKHNYPNINIELLPLYKISSVNVQNVVYTSFIVDGHFLGVPDENGNFENLLLKNPKL